MVPYGRHLPLLLCLAPLACTPSEPWTSENPTFALRAFLTALNTGDYQTVWEFLSEPSRQLFSQADTLHRQTLDPDPAEQSEDNPLSNTLIRVWTPSAFAIESLSTTERTDHSARVTIHSVFGVDTTVSMAREQDRWTIDLTPDAWPHPLTE